MAKKTVAPYQHPLDFYLSQSEDDGTSKLDFLAREYAQQPFDAEHFRRELSEKLNRLRYPQPEREHAGKRKTFAQVLEKAGVLSDLLSDDTLRELWKSQVLKKVFQRSREITERRQSAEGTSLKEDWKRVDAMQRDLKEVERLTGTYELENMEQAMEKINRRILDTLRPIMLSKRPGSKRPLIFWQ
jgi:hypothetical protein